MGWRLDRLPHRPRDARVIAGVCGGLAAKMGIDVAVVRAAFAVLTVVWIGPPLYLLAWLILPAARTDAPRRRLPHRRGRPPALRQAAGLVLMLAGAVVLARSGNLAFTEDVLWPLLLVGVGVGVVVWRTAPDSGSARSSRPRFSVLRIAAGMVMLTLGIGLLAATRLSLSAVRDGVLSAGLAVGGVALIVGPWVSVLVRERREERLRRLLADERAETAAHLHDSVLQTLALMQRSDDAAAMSALARRQERELRRWLYGERVPSPHDTVREAVERLAVSAEDRYGVVIEVVTVGNAPMDAACEALVAAAGEAMTNAARWSECSRVDVYVEAAHSRVEAYVRDRGVGFDRDAVNGDCRGIKDSIEGRLARVGGTCDISTAAGVGTEVHLAVGRS
ncbi:PspC domain-containing protein [Candidatus Poriferisodalis sp.]|uniref:ATP-binding protein n=1 Tax=Candidatus Poriferisodalis sp. TaxID=3101277 RepID=UPI003B029C50